MMRCGRLKAKAGLTFAAARCELRKRSVALVGRCTRGVARPADFDHSYDAPRPCASLDSRLRSRAVELRDCLHHVLGGAWTLEVGAQHRRERLARPVRSARGTLPLQIVESSRG